MKRSFIILLFLFSVLVVRADEGKWLLSLLNKNIATMQDMGCKLSAEDIYSINHSSLKDAIVGLGTEEQPFQCFCTGEIISEQGLMLTNHHCGLPYVQKHSTLEHNYLNDGFWARNFQEELTNPGLTASILEGIEDVSELVNRYLNDNMNEKERAQVIESIQQQIVEQVTRGTNLSAQVQSMFNGNQFFLFVYKVYRDIRLVGVPPQSIGKFGGESDNWVWPRHTGDFSMFRIYTNPEGEPASYSPKNIPLKPKHSLPISLKGVQKNDFTMILGFPGMTNRFLTSYGLRAVMDDNAVVYNVGNEKLRIMKEGMDKDPKTKIQYAAKYATCANAWKYVDAQNKAVKKLQLIHKKEQLEKDFTEWVHADPQREIVYGHVLDWIRMGIEKTKDFSRVQQYAINALLQGGEAPAFAYRASDLLAELCNTPHGDKKYAKTLSALKEASHDFFNDFNGDVDANLTASMLKLYATEVEPAMHPDIIGWINQKYKGNFERFALDLRKNSIFMDEVKFNKFIEHPDAIKLENDLCYRIAISLSALFDKLAAEPSDSYEMISKGSRLFVKGMLLQHSEKMWAPDANFTIRLTYGKVCGYAPRDGVYYDYYTTLSGVFEKERPLDGEYEVPGKLKDLYLAKDFAPYGKENMNVCFITNNDITGGNSGSPVINGNGELVGVAFDGNYEAMSGDLNFEENLQRCISFDIRYVLFIIDKFAQAHNLIQEMKIVA